MEQKSPVEDLKKIRSLMENSVIYHSLSGLSGVAAGAIGIVIFIVVYGIVDPIMEQNPGMKDTPEGQLYLMKIFFAASAVCVALAFGAILFFNARKAARAGEEFYSPPMKKMFINLFIPLITGGIYCLMLVQEKEYLFIAPTMLIFYGLGMLMASRHTIIEIRYLGFAELALGLIAIFFKQYGMLFWPVGFGILNILYGFYIYRRYDRNNAKPASAA